MNNNQQDESNEQRGDHWSRLDAFLRTDLRDAGCDTAMEMLDVYAELVATGADPSDRFPGIRAHFVACGPCAEDLEGLLAAIDSGLLPRPNQP